jgi:hypothetical protein
MLKLTRLLVVFSSADGAVYQLRFVQLSPARIYKSPTPPHSPLIASAAMP